MLLRTGGSSWWRNAFVDWYHYIVVEDLIVSNMIKNHHLSLSIYDAG